MDGNQDTRIDASQDETPFDEAQNRALRSVADCLHRLNRAITQAVDAGITVELMRASRYHANGGIWGDQMIPIIHRRS